MSGDNKDVKRGAVNKLVEAGIGQSDARFEVDDLFDASGSEEEFESFISRRAGGEPASYITGRKYFYKECYFVRKGVLIPRSDTEILVECCLKALGVLDMAVGDVAEIPQVTGNDAPGLSVADLCCGSGCVGISVSNEAFRHGLRNSGFTLSDISDIAIGCSGDNIASQALDSGSIDLVKCDVLSDDVYGLKGKPFDIIVSNPPYVTDDEMKELPPDVKDHEPSLALRGGPDGLLFYRRMCSFSPKLLNDGGALIVEHGCDQGEAVRRVFSENGFKDIITVRDYAGNDRVTFGRFYAG